jgi:hypothetical protein
LIRIVDVGGLASRDHVAGHSLAERKTNFAHAVALQHLAPDLAAPPIDHVQRRPLRGEQLGHMAHDQPEQVVGFDRATDGEPDLQQRVAAPILGHGLLPA